MTVYKAMKNNVGIYINPINMNKYADAGYEIFKVEQDYIIGEGLHETNTKITDIEEAMKEYQ